MEAAVTRVWPTEEAMEDALFAELASADTPARVLGTLDLTWPALVERVTGVARADAVVLRLGLRAAAERARLGPAATTRGFLSAAARFVAEGEQAALPTELPKPVGVHTAGLLSMYASVARPGQVRLPPGFSALDIQPRLDWAPADVELLVALARHIPVRVRLPWAPGRPAIYGGLEAILGAFEKHNELERLELVLEDPADGAKAARPLVSALYYGAAPPPRRGVAAVKVLAAPHPFAELRAVAAHVRRLVDGGAAPESIAIAVRAVGGAQARTLAEELRRAGLVLDDRPRPPLASAPPVRLCLSLLEIEDAGWAREDVLALVGSRYIAAEAPAQSVARMARSLGLRRFDDDGLARLERAPGGARLAAAVRTILSPLASLPPRATLGEHAAALRRALATLGVGRRARFFVRISDGADGSGGSLGAATLAGGTDARIEFALARDQAAIAALEMLLGRLAHAARQAGFVRTVTRAEVVAILTDLAAEVPLRTRGIRGGAVRLLPLCDLAARRFDHVVLPGLVEGRAPLAGADDGVYGERERREINRALGRWALPSFRAPVGDDGPLPTERTPYETLMLVSAVAAARRSVLLSYAETDDDRPVARSPFVDEVLRAAPWIPLARAPLSPLPSLDEAAAAADVLGRIALESFADPAMRLPPRPSDPAAGAWLSALRAEGADVRARSDRVEALASVERSRWRYFAGEEAPHAWVGAAPPIGGTAQLGGPDLPLPARQLELLANCPFSFLAARLLGVEAAVEAEDAPSALRVGRIAHRCLEVYYRRGLNRAGGAGAASDRAALESACDQVFAEAEAEGPSGDRRLWELGKLKLVEDLWRVVSADLPWAGRPVELELSFGPRAALPALVIGGVHVSGRIDRLDRTADGHVVIDYKLGGKAAQQAKLRAAGDTQLQLPIYAAAVRAAVGGPVDAGFISIKDAAARTLGAARTGELLDRVLPGKLAALGERLRAGTFEIAPEDCRGCDFRTVCRVVHLNEEEEIG